WMLNIATPLADALGLEAPTLSIIRTITDLSLSSVSFLDLNVFRDTDPFTMALRETSRQYPLAEDWFSGYLRGTDVDRLYIYRCLGEIHQYRGFYLGAELAPRHDTSYTVCIRVYPPVEIYRRGTVLRPKNGLPALIRSLGITGEAAATHRLLDRYGSQPRVWAFLTERGLDYAKRIIDLILDRHISTAIPERELLLTGDMADFPFTTQAEAALLATEFAAPSRV